MKQVLVEHAKDLGIHPVKDLFLFKNKHTVCKCLT